MFVLLNLKLRHLWLRVTYGRGSRTRTHTYRVGNGIDTVLKTAVLPLHYAPVFSSNCLKIASATSWAYLLPIMAIA